MNHGESLRLPLILGFCFCLLNGGFRVSASSALASIFSSHRCEKKEKDSTRPPLPSAGTGGRLRLMLEAITEMQCWQT